MALRQQTRTQAAERRCNMGIQTEMLFDGRCGRKRGMTTDTLKVVIEPDDDRWYAYCPALVERGGATWGATPEEALASLETVVRMVVTSLSEPMGT
jgi:predicted RNase H-like HicB family nuclease